VRRFCRCLLLAASAGCVALLGAGYYDLHHHGSAGQAALNVEQPEQILTGMAAGNTYDIAFQVVNRSGETRRIIGAEYGCGSGWGFRLKECCSVEVPPHGTVVVPFILDVRTPGPFEMSVPLYLDDDGLRVVVVTVKGVAAPAYADQTQ